MILLLEDNEGDAIIAQDVLTRLEEKHTVVHVTTLQDAIEMLYERKFSLIITDLMLSDTTSYDEAVKKLSATHPTIPLIVLSNHDDCEKMLSLGAHEVVNKNSIEELLPAVRKSFLRKTAESTIRQRLTQDTLTKLSNRAHFLDMVERSITKFRRYGDYFSVIYIDLDNFKPINDTHGHKFGDIVLHEVGNRISTTTREMEVAARIGGDEFALLVETTNPASIAQRLLRSITVPITINDLTFTVGASIGYTVAEPGVTARDMIEAADNAMYRAKRDGGGRYYSASPHPRNEYEKEVSAALERNEFYLVYQPQIDINEDKIISVEALLRWHRPDRARSSPEDFMPVLESVGEIIPVGEWVIEKAIQAYPVLSQKYPNVALSINISSQQLDHNLSAHIEAMLAKYNFNSSLLTLEITEHVLLRDNESIKLELDKIKSLGVKLSLDDFGIGYSSLAALLKAPIDELKIDKTFIHALPSKEAKTLIGAVVDLGKRFGADVVAEGVETIEQNNELKTLGVTIMQGYLHGYPASLS